MPIVPSLHLLTRLRQLMRERPEGPIDAYLVPYTDEHQNEIPADCDKRLAFISKHKGFYGHALITKTDAILFTDRRFYKQAQREVDENWALQVRGAPGCLNLREWIASNIPEGSKIGFQPCVLRYATHRWINQLAKGCGISLVAVNDHLIDQIWEDESILLPTDERRPARKNERVKCVKLDATVRSWQRTIGAIREELVRRRCPNYVFTNMAEIAWIFRLIGADLEYAPIFYAYCIVTPTSIVLFIDYETLDDQVFSNLHASTTSGRMLRHWVKLQPYDRIFEYLSQDLKGKGRIGASYSSSFAICHAIHPSQRYYSESPVISLRQVMDDREMAGMISANMNASLSICQYLSHLQIIVGDPEFLQLSEKEGAEFLIDTYAKTNPDFTGHCFPYTSAVGKHSFEVHHTPSLETDSKITKQEVYTFHFGLRYSEGTSSIARTVHFGTPSYEQRQSFTLALKGHIQLAMTIFPETLSGFNIDLIARRHLWSKGRGYPHSTCNNMGVYMTGLEFPPLDSYRPIDDPGIRAYQAMTNSVGCFCENQYGVRIGNVMVTRKNGDLARPGHRDFLKFDTISYVPIQIKMIDIDLLDKDEINWLNEYHNQCKEKLMPVVRQIAGMEHLVDWLEEATEEIIVSV